MGQEVGKAVVGYEWEAVDLSPPFDSVSLPQWDPKDTDLSTRYEVHVWENGATGYTVLGSYPTGEEINFPREDLNGPHRFKVLGIDPKLRICPGDRSFTWSFRLTYPDIKRTAVVRTPITVDLPQGEKCEMR